MQPFLFSEALGRFFPLKPSASNWTSTSRSTDTSTCAATAGDTTSGSFKLQSSLKLGVRSHHLSQHPPNPPQRLGTPRPGTEVSRALRARNPKRVRKGVPASEPQSRKKCAPESEKSPKRVRSCVFGLSSDSVVHSWGLPALGHPLGLFLDSFGVPAPKGPGDPCAWPGGSQHKGQGLCKTGGFGVQTPYFVA